MSQEEIDHMRIEFDKRKRNGVKKIEIVENSEVFDKKKVEFKKPQDLVRERLSGLIRVKKKEVNNDNSNNNSGGVVKDVIGMMDDYSSSDEED